MKFESGLLQVMFSQILDKVYKELSMKFTKIVDDVIDEF